MRKIYISRESLFPIQKPFYKRPKTFLLLCFVIVIVYFAYQIFWLNKIQSTAMETTQILVVDNPEVPEPSPSKPLLEIPRGIRLRDLEIYSSKLRTQFKCIKSGREIPHEWVNDNYCDCPEDGSDEPGTSACPNGVFYCRYQARHKTGRGAYEAVPSGRVNDAICDCCDGSDEFESAVACPINCR